MPGLLLPFKNDAERKLSRYALCSDEYYDSEDWFADPKFNPEAIARARSVCGECAVFSECQTVSMTPMYLTADSGVMASRTAQERMESTDGSVTLPKPETARSERVWELWDLVGLNGGQIAERLGMTKANVYTTLLRYREEHGYESQYNRVPEERDEVIRELYAAGHTLSELGKLFGLTKGRISQIVKGVVCSN